MVPKILTIVDRLKELSSYYQLVNNTGFDSQLSKLMSTGDTKKVSQDLVNIEKHLQNRAREFDSLVNDPSITSPDVKELIAQLVQPSKESNEQQMALIRELLAQQHLDLKQQLQNVLNNWVKDYVNPIVIKLNTARAVQEGNANAIEHVEKIAQGQPLYEELRKNIQSLSNKLLDNDTSVQDQIANMKHELTTVIQLLENIPQLKELVDVTRKLERSLTQIRDAQTTGGVDENQRFLLAQLATFLEKYAQVEQKLLTQTAPDEAMLAQIQRNLERFYSDIMLKYVPEINQLGDLLKQNITFMQAAKTTITNEDEVKNLNEMITMRVKLSRIEDLLQRLVNNLETVDQSDKITQSEELTHKIGTLTEQLTECGNQLNQRDLMIQRLEDELKQWTPLTNIPNKQEIMKEVREQGMNVTLDELQNYEERNKEKVDQLTIEVASLRRESAQLTKERKEMELALVKAYTELNDLRTSALAGKKDVEQCQRSLDEAATQRQIMKKEIDLLRGQLNDKSRIQQQLDEVKQQLASEREQCTAKFDEAGAASFSIYKEQLEKIQTDYQKEIQELKLTVLELEAKLDMNNDTIAVKERELAIARQEAAARQQEVLKLNGIITELTSQKEVLTESQRTCIKQLENVQKNYEKLLAKQKQRLTDTTVSSVSPTENLNAQCLEAKDRAMKAKRYLEQRQSLLRSRIDWLLKRNPNTIKPEQVRSKFLDKRPHLTTWSATLEKPMHSIDNVINKTVPCTRERIDELEQLGKEFTAMNDQYDDIMDLYEDVHKIGRVFIRLKPMTRSGGFHYVQERLVSVAEDEVGVEKISFQNALYGPFDYIIKENEPTVQVFDQIEGWLKTLHKGYNIVLLTYGQSGSGKTYTLLGQRNANGQMQDGLFGMVLRWLNSEHFEINVKMFQIYMKYMYDMNTSGPVKPKSSTDATPFATSADATGSIRELKAKQLSEYGDGSSGAIVDYLSKHRFQRATRMNPDSSRSHAFVLLECTNNVNGKTSNILFCDLGGNEQFTAADTSVAKEEGKFITHTLGDLSHVIMQNHLAGKSGMPAGTAGGMKFINVFQTFLLNNQGDMLNKLGIFIHLHSYKTDNPEVNNLLEATTKFTLKFATDMVGAVMPTISRQPSRGTTKPPLPSFAERQQRSRSQSRERQQRF